MNEQPEPLINRLLAELAIAVKRDDRGLLANVRRGFSESTEIRAYPYVAPYCDLSDARERRIVLTVAAGFATLAPAGLARNNCGNMGATLRRLALSGTSEKPDDALSTFEARFRRLLTCQSTGELCEHLATVFRAAANQESPVDFKQLYWDLVDWERRERRDVRVAWAKGYWGVANEAEVA